MSITIVEKASARTGTISVRAYFDPEVSNMGLEKYGISMWDGVYHEEQLAEINVNGVRRYITGLNEFAPDVKLLPEDLREAKIKEIRKIVAKLERELATNVIDPELVKDLSNEKFWNHVKMLRPDNEELWGKITLRVSNQPLFLNPEDPYDLIKIYAIEAGGFSIVARSYEDARSRPVPPKFYLDKYQETVSTTTEVKKLRNKAVSELETLFNQNPSKLFYVAKIVDGNSAQYKKNTPNDIIYDNMDKYINGEGVERTKKRAAQTFLDVCKQDMETLKLRALVKDATFYRTIIAKPDGFIYHTKSNTMLGRNAADVVEHLKNPLNDQMLGLILKEIERLWNQ